jgi:hypothetical protein
VLPNPSVRTKVTWTGCGGSTVMSQVNLSAFACWVQVVSSTVGGP